MNFRFHQGCVKGTYWMVSRVGLEVLAKRKSNVCAEDVTPVALAVYSYPEAKTTAFTHTINVL
jgi:hypothetical protein